MSQKISYNANSINSRLLTGFITLCVVAILVVFTTMIRFVVVVQSSENTIQDIQPAQVLINDIGSNANLTNVLLQHFITTKNFESNTIREITWSRSIMPNLDSLEILSGLWTNPEDQVVFKQVSAKLQELNALQRQLQQRAEQEATFTLSLNVLDYADRKGDTIIANNDFQLWIARELDKEVANQPLNRFNREGIPLTVEINELTQKLSQNLNAYIVSNMEVTRVNFSDFRNLLLLLALGLMGLTAILYRYVARRLFVSINEVKEQVSILSEGNLPGQIKFTDDELSIVLEEIQELTSNLANVKNFALEVGNGKFDTDISVFNNEGEIGRSLAEMRESLKRVAAEDTRRNWTNQGFARFGEVLRKSTDDLEKLSDDVLMNLIKYLDAHQGTIFLVNDGDDDHHYLEMKAYYAYDRKKFLDNKIELGQGLIGQTWREGLPVYLTDIPDDYLNIISGLGSAVPKSLMIVPLTFNNKIYGILELASFHFLKEHEQEFIVQLAESIASAVSTVRTNENTKRLLQDSQNLAAEMASQEQEMRQSFEEIQKMQEEMARGNAEVNAQSDAISSGFCRIEINPDKTIQTLNNLAQDALGYRGNDLQGVDYNTLFSNEHASAESVNAQWEEVVRGVNKMGEFKFTGRNGQLVVGQGLFFGLLDKAGKLMKVMYLFQDITQQQIARHALNKFSETANENLCVAEYDMEGHIISANEPFLDLLGFKFTEISGQDHDHLFFDKDKTDEQYFRLWHRLNGGEKVVNEYRFRNSEYGEIWTQSSFTPVKDIEGDYYKVIHISYDISKYKILLDQTRQEIHKLENANEGLAKEAQIEGELKGFWRNQMANNSALLEKLQNNEAILKDSIRERQERLRNNL